MKKLIFILATFCLPIFASAQISMHDLNYFKNLGKNKGAKTKAKAQNKSTFAGNVRGKRKDKRVRKQKGFAKKRGDFKRISSRK